MSAETDLSFRTALRRLDAAGLLMKVENKVDLHLELASILFKQPLAVLFKSVNGHAMRVAGNCLLSEPQLLAIFRKTVPELRRFLTEGLGRPIAPVMVPSGPVQDVVYDNPDLGTCLPIPHFMPEDGGRYISAGVVVARDPDTGVYNASYHRLMLAGGNRLLIKLDQGRHLRLLYEKMQARNRPLPIAIIVGTDVATLYSAGTSGALLPIDVDEYEIASGIQGRPLELVECRTVPLAVPADAEIVLEGHIAPAEMVQEGPFLEFTGLYSDVAPAPVTTITCLYHRRDPVFHVMLSSEATIFRKHVFEGMILKTLKAAAPCVTDVALTPGGLYRFHLVVQVRKRTRADEGMQRNAMAAALAATKDVDLIIAVDDDIDVHDWRDIEWALAMRWEGSTGTMMLPHARGHEYAVISDGGLRTKVCIDATLPFGFQRPHKRPVVTMADMTRYTTTTAPELQDL